ncbi:MAG: alkaline phosphatase family protein [Acidobacteriota bacterium]
MSRRRHRSRQELERREFLRLLGGGAAAMGGLFPLGCSRGPGAGGRRVVVLGLDGLDPNLIQSLIAQGRAPNFKKLMDRGCFRRLGTTMPALSPVAWSSFITGLSPGGHGVGDFILRDRNTYLPVFSIFETRDPWKTLQAAGCDFPIEKPFSGSPTRSLRKGTPFWAHLTSQGIPAVVIKIPTNFPVDETATRGMGGMGTPDLADAYGLFNYYTSDPFEDFPNLSGGYAHYVEVQGRRVRADLLGPQNTYCPPDPDAADPNSPFCKQPFVLHLDKDRNLARLDINGQKVVLEPGKFSDWVEVQFDLIPMIGTATGICRFLLKEITPHVKLYATPINLDLRDEASGVTYPPEYGSELAEALGPLYTKGLPADTKAFDMGVFSDEDYVKQAETILEERLKLFEYEWERFEEGLFYFYVSSTDQDTHMLWRNMDPTHPLHAEADPRFADYIPYLYERMDELVGRVLPAADDDTLVLIASDHGFAQFGRQFHLNTWLRENNFLSIKDEAKSKTRTTVLDVDWDHTYAYAMGFNGLYLNMKGRERDGVLEPGSAQAKKVLTRLQRGLMAFKDDDTGQTPVAQIYHRDQVYEGDLTWDMPELLVGFRPGYRQSADSVLTETGPSLIDLNPFPWSGDHSMARDLVPGVLFSSRAFAEQSPTILDLPVTILDFFGIEKPSEMVGSSLL